MTRHSLDTATVATIIKLMATKRGLKTLAMVRARYYRAMNEIGATDSMIQYHGFKDCYDMAELEVMAA